MNPITGPPNQSDEAWYASIRVQIRRGFILGTIGYFLVAVVIIATLISLLQGVRTAESQLADVSTRLGDARVSLAKTQASLDDLQKEYTTVSAQKAATDQALTESRRQIDELKQQISQARCALDSSRSALEAFHQREYGAAVHLYEQALACEPDNAYLLNLQAYSLFKDGKLEEALATQRRSAKADPNYAWGQFDLARFLCALGPTRFSEAKTAINETLRLRPDLLKAMRGDGEFRRLCKGLTP
jgi:tetratricopeptide (TPR) repeat protein